MLPPSIEQQLQGVVPTDSSVLRVLSRQSGAIVRRHKGSIVEKEGHRVRPTEEAALRLVRRHTNVPVPEVFSSSFEQDNGCIRMSYIDGEPLDRVWDDGNDEQKEMVCRQVWRHIYSLRQIPKPPEFSDFFQCSADGIASHDVLTKPLPQHDTSPLANDADLRNRIYERYLHFNGRRYMNELPSMLLQSDKSVFTHADLAPRNILIGDGDDCPVIGIVDWEFAGWYPEYWEYANIMKPSMDRDWQEWMTRTAPEEWDLSCFVAARRVLF